MRMNFLTMETLEPWNMFTNDLVDDEENEVVINSGNANEASPAPAEAKHENADEEETDHCHMPVIKEELPSSPPTAGEDEDDADNDDALFNFNFNMEPAVRTSERRAPPSKCSRTIEYADNMQINFEVGVVYICPACGAEFDVQDAWKRHMNSLHNFNTRRGLNFLQIDKLYHECLYCHKRIAMHSMENLLKHKFTHLPYRCTKCKFCLRQYKYRQDLMVHLRMIHREDVLEIIKAAQGNPPGKAAKSGHGSQSLEIMDIKENAVDIFEGGIEVKNELIEPDDIEAEQATNSYILPSFLEEALSRSSSRGSEHQSASENDGVSVEKHIQYVCPACGTDFSTQTQWLSHIEHVHDYGTEKGLNFKEVHNASSTYFVCLECKKPIYAKSVRKLQYHKFTHLPQKGWLRCKLCFRYFVGRKEIEKHLRSQHHLNSNYADMDENQDGSSYNMDLSETDPNGEDSTLLEPQMRNEERDIYESQIEYLCPKCGQDFSEKKMWRKHIVKIHHFTDLKVLNFKLINDRQVICLECAKVITNAYGVQNAQQHCFTHLPYKAFIRCRLCAKSYTDRKGLVKHLRSVHNIGRDESFKSYIPVNSPTPSPVPPLKTYSSYALRDMPKAQDRLPAPKKLRRPKEIVRHADYTYEIQFLDDEDDGIDNTPVPELTFNNSFSSHFECDECGSIFSTQQALQTHTQEEHEFLDFNNGNNKQEFRRNNPRKSVANTVSASGQHQRKQVVEQQSKDAPAPTTEQQMINPFIHEGIERHFCYLCPACGMEYKAQMEWRRHINVVHNFDKRHFLNFQQINKFRYRCTQCGDVVANSKLKGLQDHKFRHLPYKLYIKCLVCGNCYNHKPNMISHLKQRHNITEIDPDGRSHRPYKIHTTNMAPIVPGPTNVSTPPALTKLPMIRNAEDNLSFHNAVDHESIMYICPACNKSFEKHIYWRKHIVEEHNLNNREGLNFRQIDYHHFLCLQCYKRVTVTHTKGAIGQLQSHKFRHLPYKSFKCTTCQSEFVRKQMFFKHLNRTTNRCEYKIVNGIDLPTEHEEQVQDNGNTAGSNEHEQITNDNESAQQESITGVNGALIINQAAFSLVCPQCGEEFYSWQPWYEHIDAEHDLTQHMQLNFKRINSILYECNECTEQVNGSKLRDLQIHKFKHLPYGAYLHCKFCMSSYFHIRQMQTHLRQKHPNVVQKHDEYATMEELQRYEENGMGLSIQNANMDEEAQEACDDFDEQYLLG